MPRSKPRTEKVTAAGREVELAVKRTTPSGPDKSIYKNVVKCGEHLWAAYVTRNGEKYYLKTIGSDEVRKEPWGGWSC